MPSRPVEPLAEKIYGIRDGKKPTVPLLAASWCRALNTENELDAWKLSGLKVLWALLALYLLAAVFVSSVGSFGMLRVRLALFLPLSHPFFCSLILPVCTDQLTRPRCDCSTADFAFTAFLTVLAAYDPWAPARLAGMLVLTIIRLHFLLVVSTHYAHLVATAAGNATAIHLLPLPPNVRAADVVYAPVHAPAGSALERSAEVWVRGARAGGGRGAAQRARGAQQA
ncbi:hypothetical protein FB451DRAFT_1527538 [Mycena latifolia]|nr:hypothetical protein FB451DRAFT_1527538 [Mycena latifolia]